MVIKKMLGIAAIVATMIGSCSIKLDKPISEKLGQYNIDNKRVEVHKIRSERYRLSRIIANRPKIEHYMGVTDSTGYVVYYIDDKGNDLNLDAIIERDKNNNTVEEYHSEKSKIPLKYLKEWDYYIEKLKEKGVEF